MKTMAQIAEEAGLSRFTVSKILNGDTSVKKENRKKVLELCEKYGFVPNSNAVNLVSRSSRVIGMIVPYITDGFYAELIELTEKYASAKGMGLVYQSSYNDITVEEKILRSFMGLNVAAILLVPVVGQGSSRIRQLAAADLPVICLDRPVAEETFSCVLNDNRSSSCAMTSHLLEKTRQVYFLDSFYRDSNPTALARRQGYLDAMASAGAEPLFIPLFSSCEQQDNERYGYEHLAAFLKERSRPPEALYCVTDAVALGAMRALREAGFVPGKDTLVGGHDNLHFCEYTTPALTSMAQPKEQMAQIAVDMALARIADKNLAPEVVTLKSLLVIRDSSC
ncbi:MAG: LacI family DNA-binding transcriptional regulator [Lentisphaeria bacterium]|nr:LacI family DNA-binding transcriptional regulator [Lentisphaeria bacterium]